MHRSSLGICVVAAVLVLSGRGSSGEAPASTAQAATQATRCGLADLRGTYGFVRSGVNPQGPIAAVGVAQFDGDGGFTATQSTVRNGTLTQGGFSGTYDVTPDCRGVWYDTSSAVIAHFVLLDGGNELFFLSLSPGNTLSGHSKRIAPLGR